MKPVPHGEPYAGKLHVWFDEGAGVPDNKGRPALLYTLLGLRRLVAVMYPDDEVVSLAYDEFGNEIAASNEVSSVVSLCSEQGDSTNETAVVSGGASADEAIMISRAFDVHRRLTELDGTIYDYNADGLLASISNAIALVECAYTPDRHDAGYTLTLSNGVVFSRSLLRDGYRRSLVTGISSAINGVGVDGLTYTYDAISRPTSRNNDTFGYNERGEVVFSRRDAENAEDVYSYDDIGNLLLSAWTTTTNAYTANNLNQYTLILCASASLGTRLRSAWLARIASPACAAVTREASYDPDGNLTNDNAFA